MQQGRQYDFGLNLDREREGLVGLGRGAESRALILITHDLAVAAGICDHLMVMQEGRCVESGTLDRVLSAPQHPYTRALLAPVRSLATHRETRPGQ